MLAVQVAILSLFHPQAVTVNDVPIVREGAQIRVANRVQGKFNTSGTFRIRIAPDFQRTYSGALEVTARNGELRLILAASEEDLVAATVSAESPPGAPAAALEAQAIVARSWIRASKGRHGQYDLCDTTHCQHFKEPSAAGTAAAKRTRGLVLAWQGAVFAPAYSASCGGRTQTAAAIGWEEDNGYPYFAVDCPVCLRDEREWTRDFDDAAAAMIRRAPNREKTRLLIGRRLGWDALPGNHYTLDGLQARGRGQGHGVGYCQRGGAGMAKQGASPAAILRHYFPGANIMGSR